jgi:hypothetical protein
LNDPNELSNFEHNGKILNAFLTYQQNIAIDKNKSFLDKFIQMYLSLNKGGSRQFKYVEDSAHDNPLLFELREFRSDLNRLGKHYNLLKLKSTGNPITISEVKRISSYVNDIVTQSESVQQIPKKRKLTIRNTMNDNLENNKNMRSENI